MSDTLTVQCGPAERDGRRAIVAMVGSRQQVDKFDPLSEFHRRKFRERVVERFRLTDEAHEAIEQSIMDAIMAADDAESAAAPMANIVNLATVQPRPISWHWDQTIPRGAMTYIFGDAGEGKSQLATDIVSRRSRGASMPPHDFPGDAPTNSLILTCEDDIERTVVPRLLATDADLSRIDWMSEVTVPGADTPRMVQLPGDLPTIKRHIVEREIDTVVLDVFTGFLGEGVNPNADAEMRAVMARINRVAVETQSTWLLLGHPNKREGAKSHYRAGGSVAILAAARAGFAVGQHPDDPTTKVFCPVKFNLGPRPHSLTFSIEAAGQVSRLVWGGHTDLTAADVLKAEAPKGSGSGKLEQAKQIIIDILADGPRGSSEVLGACEAAGIGERTFHTARKALGVKSERVGGIAANGQWLMTMPANGYQDDDF